MRLRRWVVVKPVRRKNVLDKRPTYFVAKECGNVRREIMKKLLILMLVFGLASAANAIVPGSYSLRVSPNNNPMNFWDTESNGIEVTPDNIGQTLWIGVYNSVQGSFEIGSSQQGFFYLGIVHGDADGNNISWTGNWTLYQPPLVADPYHPPFNEYYGVQAVPPQWSWTGLLDVWGLTLMVPRPDLFQGVGILDAVELHLDSAGTDTVVLINADGEVIDSIGIVPEPMTITLLGIGGLAMVRWRRCSK
jgi:hypothetical protein